MDYIFYWLLSAAGMLENFPSSIWICKNTEQLKDSKEIELLVSLAVQYDLLGMVKGKKLTIWTTARWVRFDCLG